MKLIFDGKEITLKELKEIEANLLMCPADGGTYEEIVVDEITDDAICFAVYGFSTF